ncbi:MAG: hypothetical protein MAG715_00388 [Methanonatronarchaeales archaeon]|nr:hypothetical protein [Methanonatronarchaeales archaeon]
MDSPNTLQLSERELEEIGPGRTVEGVSRTRKASFQRLDMQRDADSISITPGKIRLTIDDPSREEVLSLLERVAEIDLNAHHEMRLNERYENIEDYERDGYVLASYAKIKGGLYRVVFQVPFHSENALRRFAEELPETDFEESVFWEGNDARIAQTVDVFSNEGWSLTDAVLDVDREVCRGTKRGREARDTFEKILSEE